MLRVVPYTSLSGETARAMRGALFVRVDEQDGYRELLAELWRRGDPFVLVEHDVAPTDAQLVALERCPEPWCHYGYTAADWTPTFGCVRFSADLIAGTAGVFDDPSWPWCQLDARFQDFARDRGWTPHWHYPSVLHLRTPFVDGDGVETRRPPTLEERAYILKVAAATLREEIGCHG